MVSERLPSEPDHEEQADHLEVSILRGNEEVSRAHLSGLCVSASTPQKKASKPRLSGRQLGRHRRIRCPWYQHERPTRTSVRRDCARKRLHSVFFDHTCPCIARPRPTVCSIFGLSAGWVVNMESYAYMQCVETSSTFSPFSMNTEARFANSYNSLT